MRSAIHGVLVLPSTLERQKQDSLPARTAKSLCLARFHEDCMREAIENYKSDRNSRHSTGAHDGKQGFIAVLAEFLGRRPERVIRVRSAFEDGNFVFVQEPQYPMVVKSNGSLQTDLTPTMGDA